MLDQAPLMAQLSEIRFGYTLSDLDQMSRAAVIADRSMAADAKTRRDIAWSAIAEQLCASENAPSRQELIRVGWQAIYQEVRKTSRGRGRPDEAWAADDYQERPRFVLYWSDFRSTPSPEGRIVESIAVGQVIAPIPATYRDALVALAAMDDYQQAAEMLGITYKAFIQRLRVARRMVLRLWHEGETPYLSPHRTDRRVGSYAADPTTRCGGGHEWKPETTYIRTRLLRGKRHVSRVCKICERERGARRAAAAREKAGVT